MLKLSKILRDWDDTVQSVASLREQISRLGDSQRALVDENRLLVTGLEGMAEELGRMRESLRQRDTETQEPGPVKTVRRVATFREFASAARLAGKKES